MIRVCKLEVRIVLPDVLLIVRHSVFTDVLKMLLLSFRFSVAQRCVHLCLRDVIFVTFKAIIRNHLRLILSN